MESTKFGQKVHQKSMNVVKDCAICYEIMIEPVTLPQCGHSFCYNCLRKAVESRMDCPICKKEISLDLTLDFPINRTIQNMIFKANERMDQFKLEMNWNQEELEQWALAARQKEEDNLTLEKFRRADEAKIKELTL